MLEHGLTILGSAALLLVPLTLLAFDRDQARRVRRIARACRSSAAASQPAAGAQLRSDEVYRGARLIGLALRRLVPRDNKLRYLLQRSGWSIRAGEYIVICCIACLICGSVLLFLGQVALRSGLLLSMLLGIGLPYLALRWQISSRQARFRSLMPDALDLIVRAVRSGLPVTEALQMIGEEVKDPVGAEFRRISDQIKIGAPLHEAMWAATRRLVIAEFNFLVISLSIQQETGGNLAEILEKLSEMVRGRERMRLKVKAMSSEARASAIIIGSLPFIMCGLIFAVSPGYMTTLFVDPRGWLMIVGGLASLMLGMLVIMKLVRFEI